MCMIGIRILYDELWLLWSGSKYDELWWVMDLPGVTITQIEEYD